MRSTLVHIATWVIACLLLSACSSEERSLTNEPIDRHALVSRHNPVITAPNKLSPLSVGNGEFAFTADVTGLQTFPEFYSRNPGENFIPPGPGSFEDNAEFEGTIPLVTQSQWGWHTFPNPENFSMEDAMQMYDANGKQAPYASKQHTPAGDWLRQNPHRLNLGRVGFEFKLRDGTPVELSDLENIQQELDLWSGTLHSTFEIDGDPVSVQTSIHPDRDILSVEVDASSLESGQIAVSIAFPYARGVHVGDPSDWTKPELHTTRKVAADDQSVTLHRMLNEDDYYVRFAWTGSQAISNPEMHHYQLSFSDTSAPMAFSVEFSDDEIADPIPDSDQTAETVSDHWETFWSSGGAIDLSESTDPRAHELERRIVLSQYLTAIQSSGSLPPQESGLTYNSWYGKFHLEMHWWHGVHFALWDRLPLFEKSLDWYQSIMEKARQATEYQGYEGIRWPKMVSPAGQDSPSTIGVFLIWQQPHPIYFAELIYGLKSDQETLEKYREIVFETADFMTSYASWMEQENEYRLGPPLIPAQEIFPPEQTFNSGFELAYWKFGLETAQRWRERLGLDRDPDWEHLLQHLPEIPTNDGLYVNAESATGTFEDPEQRKDHPTLLGSCGFLPCADVNPNQMRETLHEVMNSWNWDHTWGWDYPLVAMTAARVGEPEIAIEGLMMDVQKNTYLPNGHNYQDANLTIYLPGNGGLLSAVAMMAAGWDGSPNRNAPGFPEDGSWTVRWEGLNKLP